MALLTQQTWVWANSVRKWRIGKSGVLQMMGSQRVGHNRSTEQQQQTMWMIYLFISFCLLQIFISVFQAFLVTQIVKCLPTIQETQIWSLCLEDILEKKWQPTPVFLPGKSHEGFSPEEPVGLQFMGWQRDGHDWALTRTHTVFQLHVIYLLNYICFLNIFFFLMWL